MSSSVSRSSGALIVLGVLLIAFGQLWRIGLVPGSEVSLPGPVAQAPRPTPTSELAGREPEPTQTRVDTGVVPTPLPTSPVALGLEAPVPTLATLIPTPASMPKPLVAADADERKQQQPLSTGYAVRLAIPSIRLDTPVEQGGVVVDRLGNPVWQTLPFVAVHYGDLTALVGARGNAVIAGHVATLQEGNVFRFLYRVNFDDLIEVWDDAGREHDFHVTGVTLVKPSETSVMAQTPDETLTLITCGGTFNSFRREFSDRLIVTAKPI